MPTPWISSTRADEIRRSHGAVLGGRPRRGDHDYAMSDVEDNAPRSLPSSSNRRATSRCLQAGREG